MLGQAAKLFISFAVLFLFALRDSIFAQKSKIPTKKSPSSKVVHPINPYQEIDNRMLAIPDSSSHTVKGIAQYIHQNFSSEKEKLRAAFVWVAMKIDYDVENMYALNFFESQEDKALKTLSSKKGTCLQFATIFDMIALELGFKSYEVIGYTRQKGQTNFEPHAWSAVLQKDTWHLYDPTWSGGYIVNEKYIHKINNEYFDIAPNKMIETHFPFDYIWQLQDYPTFAKDFLVQKWSSEQNSIPFCNYKDSITSYFFQSEDKKLAGQINRLTTIGVTNTLSYSYMHDLTVVYETYKLQEKQNVENALVSELNNAGTIMNTGLTAFNNYINYRNAHFKPAKKDEGIRQMLDSTMYFVNKANAILETYGKTPDSNKQEYIQQLFKTRNELTKRHGEEKIWLENYLSKGKLGRALILSTMRVVN